MNPSTVTLRRTCKKIILITLFLSTSFFLSAGFKEVVKDIKNYGILNFVKDIGAPALLTVFSCMSTQRDILNEIYFHCTENTIDARENCVNMFLRNESFIKDTCKEFQLPPIIYLKCGISTISGLYTLYNVWKFNRKFVKEIKRN